MRMHRVPQPGLDAVALHDLLNAPNGVRPTALRLEQVELRMGGQVGAQDQGERLWEQQVAVLVALALVNEDLAGREIDVRDPDVDEEFPDANGSEQQQLEHGSRAALGRRPGPL